MTGTQSLTWWQKNRFLTPVRYFKIFSPEQLKTKSNASFFFFPTTHVSSLFCSSLNFLFLSYLRVILSPSGIVKSKYIWVIWCRVFCKSGIFALTGTQLVTREPTFAPVRYFKLYKFNHLSPVLNDYMYKYAWIYEFQCWRNRALLICFLFLARATKNNK